MRRSAVLLLFILVLSATAVDKGDHTALDTFIQNSLDTDARRFESMDQVYYTAMSLSYLQELMDIPSSYEQRILDLRQTILSFISDSRNTNGGYGNWKEAISSMESTFQAVLILDALGEPQMNSSEILTFVDRLRTENGGYFPLLNWDAPDVTSSYRALKIKRILQPSLNLSQSDPLLPSFFETTYEPPVFILGGSGYGELNSSSAELLSSGLVLKSYALLGGTDPHIANVAEFVKSLQSPNGGVAGVVGGLPTTGYTAAAIDYYLQLYSDPQYNVSKYFPTSFLADAVDYLLSNRLGASGFGTRGTSTSASLSSTFFAVRTLYGLESRGLLNYTLDYSGVLSFVVSTEESTYGYGSYPGDTPSLTDTARALLLKRIIGHNTSSGLTADYVVSSFDTDNGGFGFRPGATARVKYTYYGLIATRLLGIEFANFGEITQFILSAQTDLGGFSQIAGGRVPYISHSYWAVSTLNLLGELDELNRTSLLQWVEGVRHPTGMYSNSLNSKASILSTYRSIEIQRLLARDVVVDGNFTVEFLKYQTESGGFVNTLDKTVPTMEATYFASLLAMELGIELNWSKITGFVQSLENPDGGYALRPAFSSRISSSLYALQLLNVLQGDAEVEVEGRTEDFFAPLVTVDFIPRLQNYDEFSGSYKVLADVRDPEGGVADSYVEINWEKGGKVEYLRFPGNQQENGSWIYTFGPFTEEGIVEFRVVAIDANGNKGTSDWFYLTSKARLQGENLGEEEPIDFLGIAFMLSYILAFIEGLYLLYKQQKMKKQEVKDIFDNENTSNFHTLYLLIFMGVFSLLARVYLATGTQIFANSLLIFRFMVATVVILAAKYLIGLRSYGLFAPSVLVVSMIAVGPLWGTVIFANVFAVGYLARMLLDPYNLPVGFRIGILMLFNVATLGLLELMGEIYLIPVLSGSIFVPIIITPWIADRYVAQVKEYDHLHAFTRLVVTVVITLVAYLLMGNDTIVRFIALHPESWVILLYVLLKMSQVQKYSLFDKQRFRKLFERSDDPLSISIRNRNYIARYNAQILNPVINKYDMKMQFEKWNVPSPGILAVLTDLNQVDALFDRIPNDPLFQRGFVIKPTQSLGGIGIIVVKGIEDGNFRVGSDLYSPAALKRECRKIILGEYLSSQTTSDQDIVLIEELIEPNEKLAQISTGLPDIRVIVFRGVPVMAMARLPTSLSDGKANLKQGAIGAGIHIRDGKIFYAEWKQHEISVHPDTLQPIIGFEIDRWNEILAIACLTQKSSALGYAGVDLVVDKSGDIFVLEINKRPGLEIQNINQASLMNRLGVVEELDLDATGHSPLRAAKLGRWLDENDWRIDPDSLKEEFE